jgi:hypothetical protein
MQSRSPSRRRKSAMRTLPALRRSSTCQRGDGASLEVVLLDQAGAARGQAGHALAQGLEVDPALGVVVFSLEEGDVGLAEEVLEAVADGGVPPHALAQVLERPVAGDADQPGPEGNPVAQGGQTAEGAQEDVLGQVVRAPRGR